MEIKHSYQYVFLASSIMEWQAGWDMFLLRALNWSYTYECIFNEHFTLFDLWSSFYSIICFFFFLFYSHPYKSGFYSIFFFFFYKELHYKKK